MTYDMDNRFKKSYPKNNGSLDAQLKQQLIKYIYSTVELSNFKYKIIEYEHELPLLLKQKHYVSANLSGSNCLLIFTKIRDRFCCYLIDRKTLSYNVNQINLDLVKIMPITVRLDNSIYDGTIFDGTLIHPQGNQNKLRTFVITDLFMFRGKNMTNDKIQYKIMNLVAYLKANMKEDKMNTLDLMVNKLFEPEQIDSLVKEHIPSMKNFNIKGVAFYPEISGTKLIFMLDNSQRDGKPMLRQKSPFQKEEQMTKYVPAQPVDKKSVRYVAKYDDEPVFATFEFKKTKDTDVYKIYLVETVVRDKKSILVSKKMGIAFVPTTDCSSMCREAFSQNPNSRILMKCRFINDKSKWQPISHDKTAKFPSNFSTIEEKLQMLEENCSDEDCD